MRISDWSSVVCSSDLNPSIDEERSHIVPVGSLDTERLKGLWHDLEQRAEQYFASANFSGKQISARYQMKMRYPGQNWSLTFDLRVSKGLGDLDRKSTRLNSSH